jgi:hypothetical protein
MMDGVVPLPIDLNQTPALLDSVQPTRKRPRGRPPVSTLHARALFDEMTALTPVDSVWSILLVLRLFPMYEGDITPNCT